MGAAGHDAKRGQGKGKYSHLSPDPVISAVGSQSGQRPFLLEGKMKIPLDQFKAKMEDLRFRTQVILDEFSEIEKMYLEGDENDECVTFDVEASLADAIYYLEWIRDSYEEEL